MNRFAYLIPRLILLALAAGAIVIAGDAVTKRLLIAHLQASTGIDIDFGRLRTRLGKGKIFVNDLALADPRFPLTNLFQSDLAYLEFDTGALMERRLVIESARASQVRVNVPRTTPTRSALTISRETSPSINLEAGTIILDPSDVHQRNAASAGEHLLQPVPVQRFDRGLREVSLAWLDQFNGGGIEMPQDQSAPPELYNLASSTNERWNQDFKIQNAQLKVTSASLARISGEPTRDRAASKRIPAASAWEQHPHNPLRRMPNYDVQEDELVKVIRILEELRVRQLALERRALEDKRRFEAVYQRDLSASTSTKPAAQMSAEAFSNLLLIELHQQIATQAMVWFEGVRAKITPTSDELSKPSTPTVFAAAGQRGDFLEIDGMKRQPSTLIKKLVFDGAGRFNEQHMNFAGEAFNISNQLERQDLPATFTLRAQGETHFVLNGSFGHDAGVRQDSMMVDFPALYLGRQKLGSSDEMMVSVGPGMTAHGRIELKRFDQSIAGTMRLDFSDIALVVDELHKLAGGREMALRLNQTLSTLQQFESTAQISGSLNNPKLELSSALGQNVVDAINSVTQGKAHDQQVAAKKRIEDFYQNQIAQLNTNIENELDTINDLIDAQTQQAQALKGVLKTATARWPEIR